MKRFTCLTLLTFFAVAAGCSASSSSGNGDTEDAGSTPTKDAGKKDGTSSTTDDGGTTPTTDSGKKDSSTKDVVDTDVDTDADTDADTDGGTTDGATTDSSSGDAAATDASSDADGATQVCAPGSVTSFTPTLKQPGALHQNKCTAQQVDTIMEACAGQGWTQAGCDAALQASANVTCASCLVTDLSASTYGPILTDMQNKWWFLNVGACVARMQNDVSASGCGAKRQAVYQCKGAACDPNCSNPYDDTEYGICLDDAESGDCSTYATAADTCEATVFAGDGGAAACDPSVGGDFLTNAETYGKLFCVP